MSAPPNDVVRRLAEADERWSAPATMPPLCEWVTVPSEVVERLRIGARLRDGHAGAASGQVACVDAEAGPRFNRTAADWRAAGRNPFHKNFCGDLAEAVYAITTGLSMNEEVVRGGVPGDDFRDGVNVKHSEFLSSKCNLIVEPGLKRPTHGYALVALSVRDVVRGVILGWASNEEVDAAPLVDYGYGPKPSIHHTRLHRPTRWLNFGALAPAPRMSAVPETGSV
jgi:hypothetical protein